MSHALLAVSLLVAAPPPEIEDDLLRAVVQRLEASRKNIPDAGLLPKAGPLPLRQDSFDARAFSKSKWTLKSGAAWQADADKANATRYVVVIAPGEIKGDTAEVTIGVELIQPTKSQGIVLCCCSATDLYRREGNRWRFEKTLGTICS
jgi:hypothetical protein